ncbi:MAG TPA: hypothetical protein VLJ59_19920 [Mycobacteriales bacterium]|nr:hypothetical protein [Mycobacteriales bacterium]
MTETPWESPAEDAAEQHADVVPEPGEARTPVSTPDVPWDVDPADAAEQRAEVPIDDDDWR